MAWFEFLLSLAAFIGSHLVPARPRLKARLVARLGRGGYGAAFGILSLVLLVWVIAAAGRAPFVPLWDQAGWMRWLANLAVPAAFLLAVLAVGVPNPLSFGGRAEGFDPAEPGIAGVARHPLLWAMAIWALAHMLVNGDLAHVILFGLFAAYAFAGMRMIDMRNRRLYGAAEWQRLAQGTSNIPFAGNWRGYRPPVWRLALAVAVWLAIWHAHLPVIGVDPRP